MAGRAASICGEPGCGEIALAGTGYCTQHQKQRKPWSEGIAGRPRPSAAQRGYGSAWRKIRAAYLAKHPECELCGWAATNVDHILPKRFGGGNDGSNLQPLCHDCHQRKTSRGL